MGANIHQHIEVKKNGQWHHLSQPHVFRDYTYFGLLAGIRGKMEPIIPPRGLPDDVTFVTTVDYEQTADRYGEGKVVNASWFGPEELRELQSALTRIEKIRKVSDPCVSMNLETDYLHAYINGNPVASHQGWDDVRLVFWFDD